MTLNMSKGFREEFKFYKRKDVPLNLKNVLDFNHLKDCPDPSLSRIGIVKNLNSSDDWERNFGMKDPSHWEVYRFLNKPGLIFIKNPFYSIGQRYWIMRCLQYYTKKPNKLNIDPHNIIKNGEDWWEFCQREHKSEVGAFALEKLRWATFGYHHNWDTKEYSETSKSDFPLDLRVLCHSIAKILNFPNFNAEAAIINMYHFGSSLSGHTDHSEVNIEAPLFSFSFGQSAIFLIGGKSIEDETAPILLESGDILIMSGESRLCYHGVPRILPTENQPWNLLEKISSNNLNSKYFLNEITGQLNDNQMWEPFGNYVRNSRINMNVRQVLLPGQHSLDR